MTSSSAKALDIIVISSEAKSRPSMSSLDFCLLPLYVRYEHSPASQHSLVALGLRQLTLRTSKSLDHWSLMRRLSTLFQHMGYTLWTCPATRWEQMQAFSLTRRVRPHSAVQCRTIQPLPVLSLATLIRRQQRMRLLSQLVLGARRAQLLLTRAARLPSCHRSSAARRVWLLPIARETTSSSGRMARSQLPLTWTILLFLLGVQWADRHVEHAQDRSLQSR